MTLMGSGAVRERERRLHLEAICVAIGVSLSAYCCYTAELCCELFRQIGRLVVVVVVNVLLLLLLLPLACVVVWDLRCSSRVQQLACFESIRPSNCLPLAVDR